MTQSRTPPAKCDDTYPTAAALLRLRTFSRRVVGWALETHLQASLAIAALTMAVAARQPAPGSLIHHSDRGVQYACGDYTDILEAHGIQPSMSRIGNPYDNARAESFIKTLKHEEVDGRTYRDAHQACNAIGTFIEEVYNRQRLHSALAYRPPTEFEAQYRGQISSAPVSPALSFQGMRKSTVIDHDQSQPTPASKEPCRGSAMP